jgi:hypothetical protein
MVTDLSAAGVASSTKAVFALVMSHTDHKLMDVSPGFLGELEALQRWGVYNGEPMTALLAGMLLIELRGDDGVQRESALTVVPFVRPVASGKR